MPDSTQKEKRSRWHLSGILPSNSNKNNQLADSTYGGSEATSSQTASTNTIPSVTGSDVTRDTHWDSTQNQVVTTVTTTTVSSFLSARNMLFTSCLINSTDFTRDHNHNQRPTPNNHHPRG